MFGGQAAGKRDKGVPMSFLGIGRWQWVSPEPDAPATVEIWKNDQTPLGEPLHLSGGEPVEVFAARRLVEPALLTAFAARASAAFERQEVDKAYLAERAKLIANEKSMGRAQPGTPAGMKVAMADDAINVTPLPQGLELAIFNRESHYILNKPSSILANPKVPWLQVIMLPY